MSDLAAAQRRFVELVTDVDVRDRSANETDAFSTRAPEIARYAEALLRKRLRWARTLAYVTARVDGDAFDEAFLAWARRHPLGPSHRADAVAYLATRPDRLARTEAHALRATAMARGVAVAWDGRSLLWWCRPHRRARLRRGRLSLAAPHPR